MLEQTGHELSAPSERLRRINRRLREPRIIKSITTRRQIAEAMQALLEDCKARGLELSAIADKVWQSRDTRPFFTYQHKAGQPLTPEKARRLIADPKKYDAILKCIAELSPDWHLDQLRLRVFSAPSFATPRSAGADSRADDMAEHLTHLVHWVIHKADMAQYWKDVNTTGGHYDHRTQTFTPRPGPLSTFNDVAGGWIEDIDYLPPIPEVTLGEFSDGVAHQARLLVMRRHGIWDDAGEVIVEMQRPLKLVIVPHAGAPGAALAIWSKLLIRGAGRCIELPLTDAAHRELLNSEGESEPILPVGPYAPVFDKQGRVQYLTPNYIEENGSKLPVSLDYGTEIPWFLHRPPDEFNANPEAETGDPWWILFLPLTSSVIEHYLARPVALGTQRQPVSARIIRTWPAGSIGDTIDDPPTLDKLSQELLADALRKKGILEAYRGQGLSQRRTEYSGLRDKWCDREV